MKKIFTAVIITIFLITGYAFSKEKKWSRRKSSHFIVYYVDAPVDLIDKVIDTAEDYYRDITFDLGFVRHDYWLWEDRAKIYIYEDPDEYVAASAQHPEWSGGVAIWSEKIINTYPWDQGFFDSLLPHELGHIIFREFVGNNPHVPLWLDEGVACFQEKAKRWGADRKVKKYIEQGVFVPLEELSKVKRYNLNDRQLREVFYAEASSIVYFLIVKQGKHRFVRLCKGLKDAKTLDEAIASAYIKYDNLKELNDSWVRYLRR